MANTYIAIATVTVGSGGAANIEFTSIPGTYTDLLIKTSVRGDTAATATALLATFNGSTANFTSRFLEGNGSGANSYTSPSNILGGTTAASATSSTFSNIEIYIPNYAGSNNKSVSADSVTENNATAAYVDLIALLWSNSAAITSIKLSPNAGNFVQYSTATLYGIKNT